MSPALAYVPSIWSRSVLTENFSVPATSSTPAFSR